MGLRRNARVLAAIVAIGFATGARASDDVVPLRIVTFNAEFLSAPQVTQGQIQNYRFDDGRQQS